MQELQIPTRRISVEIVTASGEQLRGVLFAPAITQSRGATDWVLELLNDERSFLPLGVEGRSGNAICNKRHILRARVTEREKHETDFYPIDDDPEDGPCVLLLADGNHLSGQPQIETPRAASRLLDKLNHAGRFFAMRTTRGVEFVQRDLVVFVE